MSPVCQLKMTLPEGFPGGVKGAARLMNDRELAWLEVLRDLDQRRLTSSDIGDQQGS
jgi:hypothetical protein